MIGWPVALKPNGGGFGQLIRSLSGGPGLSGFEQVVPQMTDRWRAQYQIPLRTRDQMLAMRALLGRLRGRTGTVAVPAYENRYAPWYVDAYGRKFNPRFVRTRALDGTAFADPAGLNDTLILASIRDLRAPTSTGIAITVSHGATPEAGMRFSLNARLYEINSVSALGGADYSVEIWPWLRFAALPGAAVDFTTPVCEMRLASDDQGQDAMQSLAVMKFATPTLQFEEAAPVADDIPPTR